MPNHCSNHGTIVVQGDPSFLIGEKDGIKNISFRKILPIPKALEDIIAGAYGCNSDGTPSDKQIALEKKQKSNIKKYGYKDWYDFCNNEWGTKWDSYDGGVDIEDNEDGTFIVTFCYDTAWSPPIGIYQALSKDPRVISLEAYYWEPGSVFYGLYLYEQSMPSQDLCYEDNGYWVDSIDAYVFKDSPEDSSVFDMASGETWYSFEDAIVKFGNRDGLVDRLKEFFDEEDEDPSDDPSRIQEEDFRKHH